MWQDMFGVLLDVLFISIKPLVALFSNLIASLQENRTTDLSRRDRKERRRPRVSTLAVAAAAIYIFIVSFVRESTGPCLL